MPGKYSHGVVLADYSSRGIISLPADQHTKYVSSLPQPSRRSTSQARVRGTRSAQAIAYRSPSGNAEWRASTADRPHPSLSTSAAPTRTRIGVPAEEHQAAFQSVSYSQYYRQALNSTPTVNVASLPANQPAIPVLLTAYQRQQTRTNPTDHDAHQAHSSAPGASDVEISTLGREATEAERIIHPAFRYRNSNASLRKDLANGRGSNSESKGHQLRQADVSHPMNRPGTLAPSVSRRSIPEPSQKFSEGQVEPTLLPLSKQHTLLTDQHRDGLEEEGNQTRQQRQDLSAMKGKERESTSWLTERSGSSETFETQIYAPESTRSRSPLAEPNVDDFSDQDVHHESHFEVSKRPVVRRGSSSLDSVPQQHWPKKDRKDDPMPAASPRVNSKRDTSSEITTVSSVNSFHGQRAASSISGVSTMNGHSHAAATKASSSSRKANNTALTDRRPSIDGQSWRLPEIQEEHNFTPSIFEARGGHDDSEKSRMEDIERSIGLISSGKDVTFDNDAASELSAALPPPISRFRDEEDEFNANLVKMFGKGGDYAILKKDSHTVDKSSGKRKGFFSRFRSKSQPPSKGGAPRN